MKRREINRDIGLIPKLIFWLTLSFTIDFLGLFSISGSGWDSGIVLKMCLSQISSSLVLGVLFHLGAALFLTSRFDNSEKEKSDMRLILSFASFYLITTLYLILMSHFVFNTFLRFGDTTAELDLAYVYGAMFAAPIVSIIFCTLAAAIAVTVDDWRLTLLIGCSFFLVVNLFLGMPFAESQYSEVSLFSTSHFYRATILLLSGQFSTIPLSIREWAGLNPISHLIIPVLTYSILSLISGWAVHIFGRKNLRRRELMAKVGLTQVSEQDLIEETKLEGQLKNRRQAVLVCLLIFGLLIPVGGYTYNSSKGYDKLVVLYENELSSQNGTLFCETFITGIAPPSVTRWIGFPFDILDWGNCPSPIHFEYVFGFGSVNDFLLMNENDRWRFSHIVDLEYGQTSYLYSSLSGIDELAGNHYWVFRLYSDEWTNELGALRIRISVILRDRDDIS